MFLLHLFTDSIHCTKPGVVKLLAILSAPSNDFELLIHEARYPQLTILLS